MDPLCPLGPLRRESADRFRAFRSAPCLRRVPGGGGVLVKNVDSIGKRVFFERDGAVMSSSSTRAVLLFSDGRSSDSEVAGPGVPVFAVGVGALGNAPDVAVESVESPPLAYAGVPVEVTAQFDGGGDNPGACARGPF